MPQMPDVLEGKGYLILIFFDFGLFENALLRFNNLFNRNFFNSDSRFAIHSWRRVPNLAR